MSTKAMNWVWQESPSTGGRLLVLLYLAYSANADGACWPSITTLANSTRLSPRQVKRILNELEADREVSLPTGARSQNNPFVVLTGVTPATPPFVTPRGDMEHPPQVTSEGGGGVTPTRARVEPTAVEPTAVEPTTQRASAHADVHEVWSYYLAKLPSRRQLGGKQTRQIQNALKVRTIEEIKQAIDGLAASPFHNGINRGNKKYLDLHYAIVPKGDESTEGRIDKAIAWNQPPKGASMEEHVRDRLLEEIRFTAGLAHHPESVRAEAATEQLQAAGFRIVLLDKPPWARLER